MPGFALVLPEWVAGIAFFRTYPIGRPPHPHAAVVRRAAPLIPPSWLGMVS